MIHFIKHEFFLQNKTCNLTKYFFIFFVFCNGSITIVSLAFMLNIPISYLLFNIDVFQLNLVIITGLSLMATSCGVIILISSIQCYFRSNTHLLSTLLLPLIIPSIILSGIIIQSENNSYSLFLIMTGVNCIIIPISIYLSSYLIENIYNI